MAFTVALSLTINKVQKYTDIMMVNLISTIIFERIKPKFLGLGSHISHLTDDQAGNSGFPGFRVSGFPGFPGSYGKRSNGYNDANKIRYI